MNYRHAFHAGNFADVLKHAVLAWTLRYLRQKPAPLRVIETHAGAGIYDLSSEAAARTSEWREGVGRLDEPLDPRAEAFLAPYRAVLSQVRAQHGPKAYPGSPLIAQAVARANDRYIGAELHERTFASLKDALGRDERCKALALDGWVALRANAPPPERRGVVLIDPAYEDPAEWTTLAKEAAAALAKWPTGCFILWYPLKNPRDADALHAALTRQAKAWLRVELAVDDLLSAQKLAGCGLLILNPPWTLQDEMQHLLPLLAERLARSDRAGYRCEGQAA
jgi:23S rRNA (adenine2030-N6)-methyltransferase